MAAPARSGGGEVVPLRPPRRCPICGRPSERPFYPFCSKRCADIDLNRWLSGLYAIPGTADSEEEGDGAPPPREPDES